MAVGALSGPVGLGVLQLFTAWSSVLGELGARGYPTQVLRRVSVAWRDGSVVDCQDTIAQGRTAIRRLIAAAMLPTLVALLLVLVLFDDSGLIPFVALAAGLVTAAGLFALVRLYSEALKATDAPLPAVTLENLVLPAALLLVCAGCAVLAAPLTPGWIIVGVMLGLAVAALGLAAVLNGRFGSSVKSSLHGGGPGAKSDHRERHALWLGSLLSIAFLQLPFLVMPIFADTATIGVYAVAHKLVNIITTLLILMASVFGPAFARAAEARDVDALREQLRRTQRLSLGLFMPAAAVLLAAAGWMAHLFHVPADGLHAFMLILVLGQLVNAATGLSGLLLSVTGAPGDEWRATALACFGGLALAIPVGAGFGVSGLAWLFTAAIAAKNLLSFRAARRHLNRMEQTS
jgi:O-antigen/teichoic acid export membrane protein